MTVVSVSRRQALIGGAAAATLPLISAEARAQGAGMEYVFLSVVTQVPFWVDHRLGLDDAAEALGVKTSFTGPLDFDTAGQARQQILLQKVVYWNKRVEITDLVVDHLHKNYAKQAPDTRVGVRD